MATTLTDYKVLADGRFVLGPAAQHTLKFVVDASEATPFFEFTGDTGSRGMWEVLDVANFDLNGANVLQFRHESGTAAVSISDVVLWYQRQVDV